MADYPDINQSEETRLEPFSNANTNIIQTADGTPRLVVRTLPSQLQRFMTIRLVHEFINDADRQTLIDHYLNNYYQEFNWTYQADNGIFVCFYAEQINPEGWIPNLSWRIENTLIGKRV